MEQRERFILEVIAAVVFVAFLVTFSIVIVNASKGSETETTITNSFNTYNTYADRTPIQRSYVTSKPYILDDGEYVRVYRDGRFVYGDRVNYDDRHLMYDSYSQLRVGRGLFGNDINNYEVYVQNREYTGGYFKVVFHFEDYYGNVDSRSVTHYVDPREESRFVIRDVSPDRYQYRNWWYEVNSLTEVP